MRITAVRATVVTTPMPALDPPSLWDNQRSHVFVFVDTDEGVTGVGEAYAQGTPLAVGSVVKEFLAPLLVGRDPSEIPALNDLMHRRAMVFGRRGLVMYAISGVDLALWDLAGRVAGLPVNRLLGGAARMTVPAYGSHPKYDEPAKVAAAVERVAGEGFTMQKLHQTDVASVAAARAAAGDEVDIMLDTNCPWTPGEAIAMARKLEPFGLAWYEEPVWPPEDYSGLAEVRAATTMRVSCGENESTLHGFREIIRYGAADILQPSPTKVGGLSELRRIGALAAAANLPIHPHSYYWGPGLLAALQFVGSQPGDTPLEFPLGVTALPLLDEPVAPKDGQVALPTRPGLGADLNQDMLERYTVATF